MARVRSSLFSAALQVPRFLAPRHVYYRATIYFGALTSMDTGIWADGVSWCLSWLQRDPRLWTFEVESTNLCLTKPAALELIYISYSGGGLPRLSPNKQHKSVSKIKGISQKLIGGILEVRPTESTPLQEPAKWDVSKAMLNEQHEKEIRPSSKSMLCHLCSILSTAFKLSLTSHNRGFHPVRWVRHIQKA